jgi:hypothetical protein
MVITAVSYDKLAMKVFNTGSYGEALVMRSASSPLVGGANRHDDGLPPLVGKTKKRW